MNLVGALHPIPPYMFETLMAVQSRYTYPVCDLVHEDAYWRALLIDGATALIRVVSSGTINMPQLDVYIAEQTGFVPTHVIMRQMGRILGVNADLRPFYAFARQQQTLWPVIKPLYGLPQNCTSSIFEALMMTIIEQQISWVGAQKAQQWLVQWANHRVNYGGKTYYAFPSPQQIAQATIEDLTPLKITFKRMALMIDIARQICEGRLNLESLADETPQLAYKHLTHIKGIGHWTATWTITRTFGAQNYVGHNDVALQMAANYYFYQARGKLTQDELIATFERYGDYAGMAAYYTLIRWVLDKYA